jgi:hypothetical protein
MDAKRYARAGGTVAALTVLILIGCYGLSIALGHPDEGRFTGRPALVAPDRNPPTTRPALPRPKAHPPIVTTAGIPAPEQGVLIADLAVAGGRVLAVGPDHRLITAPVGADEARRFSLAPLRRGADRFMIQTATVTASGEPDCLARTAEPPVKPLPLIMAESLVATSCDAAAPAQIFQILRVGADPVGRHLFVFHIAGLAVVLDHAGNVRLGRGAGTPFCFVPWNTAEDPFD